MLGTLEVVRIAYCTVRPINCQIYITLHHVLLLISVDSLVAPDISSSSNMTVYKLATC